MARAPRKAAAQEDEPKTNGDVETNGKATKKNGAKSKVETKAKAEPKKKAEPKAKAEPKKKAEPKAKAEPKKKAEAKEKAEPKKKSEPKKKAETKKKAEPKKKASPKKKETEPEEEPETEEEEPETEEEEPVTNGKSESKDTTPTESKEGTPSKADASPKAAGRKRKARSLPADDEAKKAKKIVVERKTLSGVEGGSCLALGQGDTGQLGLGEDIMERSKPALVKSIPVKVASVVAGGMHTLALSVDGVVYSFGCNDEGALGRPIEDDEEGFNPGEVKLDVKVVQICAGDGHSVALGENGKVWYWGTFRDSSGSFGLTPDGAQQKSPVALAHHLDVAKISSGSDHVVLLTTEGALYTLGCAEQGQLGRVGERFTNRGGRRGVALLLEPDRVHSKNRRAVFTDIWAGSYDTLAQTDKDEVLACGLNNYSQLGIERGMMFYTLTKSEGLSKKWAQVSFGQHHALCLDQEGKVYAIGRADYGRLGLGKEATNDGKDDAKEPTLVPALADKKCVEVSCGTCVSFAVTDDGECYSWGMGTNGQLGHAGEDDAWEPAPMAGKQLETRAVVGISGGGQHTVMIAKEN